jgi:hypothetical protein
MFSLLFYASNTQDLRLAPFYDALRFYRRWSRELQLHPYLWDAPLVIQPSQLAWEQLADWTGRVLKNEWRRITKPKKATKWIVTDASDWGWGALCYDGHSVKTYAEPWPADFAGAGKSAHAEPVAITKALAYFVKPGECTKLYTDHIAAKYAVGKGYSPAYVVNRVLDFIQRNYPPGTITLGFIKGIWNPADAPSRDRAPTTEDIQLRDAWLQAIKLPDAEFGVINEGPFKTIKFVQEQESHEEN